MKITVERGALLKALSHVQSVVERRNTIPILSNVMIDAAKGQLKLTATDLDIEIVEAIPGRRPAQRHGDRACAHALRHRRKLPEGSQVSAELLTSEGGRLAVSSGSVRFELACLPKEDFPLMTAGALPHRFRLAADDLKRLIDKTRFAISTEETRFLPQRHLRARGEGWQKPAPACRGDGRPSPRLLRARPAGRGCRHARRDRAAQDSERIAPPARRRPGRHRHFAVGHENPVHLGWRGADLQADRRHLPRLPARDPVGQRQGPVAGFDGIRAVGGPRVDHLRRQDARG